MDIPFLNTPNLRFGLVTLTPELAQKLLAKMGSNRRLSDRLVKRHADGFNPKTVIYQPIIVDSTGRVMDGQHRLHAVIAYGKPVKCMFTIGVPASCWDTIDQGKTRSLADVLSGSKVPNCTNLAAVLSLVHRYEVSNFHNQYIPPRDTLLDDYEKNRAAFTDAAAFCVARRDITQVAPPSHIGFVHFHMAGDAPLLDGFWNVIATGAGGKQFSPALMYRNMSLDRRSAGRRQSPMSRFAMMLKCVNAEIAGTDIKSLRYKEGEDMPRFGYCRGEFTK